MKNNPLLGKVGFDKNGNLWMDTKIPYAGQLKPKVSQREWFYLLTDACKENGIPETSRFAKEINGSATTKWRTKQSLIKKGYL